MFFFDLATFWLAALLVVIIGGSAVVGIIGGRLLRDRPNVRSEPVGVVQGALLGLVGLLLAFGLTMAVGRYDVRVAHWSCTRPTPSARPTSAPQLLPEPMRSHSLELLMSYGDAASRWPARCRSTDQFDTDLAKFDGLQRQLWTQAGTAVDADQSTDAAL